MIFGFVAGILSTLFFSSHNKVASLLETFAVFATGFAGRPLGAIVFGHLGDKIGRKYTMILTMSLMGLSSLFTGPNLCCFRNFSSSIINDFKNSARIFFRWRILWAVFSLVFLRNFYKRCFYFMFIEVIHLWKVTEA